MNAERKKKKNKKKNSKKVYSVQSITTVDRIANAQEMCVVVPPNPAPEIGIYAMANCSERRAEVDRRTKCVKGN